MINQLLFTLSLRLLPAAAAADYIQLLKLCKSKEMVWRMYEPTHSEYYSHPKHEELTSDYATNSKRRRDRGLPLRWVREL